MPNGLSALPHGLNGGVHAADALIDAIERAAFLRDALRDAIHRAHGLRGGLRGFVELAGGGLQGLHRATRVFDQGGNVGALGAELGIEDFLHRCDLRRHIACAIAHGLDAADQCFLIFWREQ